MLDLHAIVIAQNCG